MSVENNPSLRLQQIPQAYPSGNQSPQILPQSYSGSHIESRFDNYKRKDDKKSIKIIINKNRNKMKVSQMGDENKKINIENIPKKKKNSKIFDQDGADSIDQTISKEILTNNNIINSNSNILPPIETYKPISNVKSRKNTMGMTDEEYRVKNKATKILHYWNSGQGNPPNVFKMLLDYEQNDQKYLLEIHDLSKKELLMNSMLSPGLNCDMDLETKSPLRKNSGINHSDKIKTAKNIKIPSVKNSDLVKREDIMDFVVPNEISNQNIDEFTNIECQVENEKQQESITNFEKSEANQNSNLNIQDSENFGNKEYAINNNKNITAQGNNMTQSIKIGDNNKYEEEEYLPVLKKIKI